MASLGLLVALGANQLSPRGLKLGHNFFPESRTESKPGTSAIESAASPADANDLAGAAAQQIRDQGLRPLDETEAERLFHDPGRESGQVVFIDARDDQNYAAGHIPGAHQLDHYHAEKYLGSVLPFCEPAEKIVVYCHGGDCEDSKFAAMLLRDAGIAKDKLFVYLGGITEWQAKGLPLERGAATGANAGK